MIAFIVDHRPAHRVEPICKVLPIAPSTYHAHALQRRDPEKLSPRAKRDITLAEKIRRIHAENFGGYGARKVWRQLMREGESVARCTVERLMRRLGATTPATCARQIENARQSAHGNGASSAPFRGSAVGDRGVFPIRGPCFALLWTRSRFGRR
jgi:hypothetical protein